MKISKLLISDRANFKPYNISPINLFFSSKNDEIEYRSIIQKNSTHHARFAIILAIIVNVSYGVLDTFIYESGSDIYYAYMIRLIFIAIPMIILIGVISFESLEKYVQTTSQLTYFIVGISWSLFAYKRTEQIVSYNFPAVIMTFSYGYFFIRLLFAHAFIVSLLIALIFSATIWSTPAPIAETLSMNTSLIVLLAFLSLAAYQKELISRQLFVSEKRERETLKHQAQVNTRYLDWLKQLAQFLRHEVRQPVAQINTSIELLQLTPNYDSRARLHLETATLSTKTVWTLIERASRATDATAFVRQGKPETIEIDKFLKETSENFRHTYSGVKIQYESESQGYVSIDRTALQETIGNLLSNAASYSDEDSCIILKLLVHNKLVSVSVKNKGPLIDGDPEELFMPFASTRSGSLSEHQGLGLYLVRLITEHYNGESGIRNQDDQSGVEAYFSLPGIYLEQDGP